MDWTPEGHFVELVLNGKYIWNYYLCDSIKIDKKRINISKEKGIVAELDLYYDEPVKFNSDIKNLPYMLKEPDAEDLIGEKADNFRDFQTYINQLENFITSEDFDDKTEEELKEKGIDIQSFVKWYLVYEITGNWEPNHPKSCYMTYDIVDSKSILKMGLIWDFDLTLLQEKPYEHFYIKDSIYYSYFFKNSYFVSELKRIWSENFYNQKEQLFTRIEDNREKLRLSAKQDIKLYSKYSNSSYVVKLNDFDAYIDHNVNFLEKRFEWLNNAISQL